MDAVALSFDAAWLARFAANGVFKGCHIDRTSTFGSRLHLAVWGRSIDQLRGLMAAGANVFATNDRWLTPLSVARAHNNINAVHYLTWEHDALVRALTRRLGRTPTRMEIYGVSAHKKMRPFRFHVRKRVDNTIARLLQAARTGDMTTVRLVVESEEIGVNAVEKSSGQSAFQAAYAQGKRDVCAYLMANGYDSGDFYCYVDRLPASILAATILTGDIDRVQRLFSVGCLMMEEMEAPTDQEKQVAAVKKGRLAMMETLIDLSERYDYAIKSLDLSWLARKVLHHLVLVKSPTGVRDAEPWLLMATAIWSSDDGLINQLLTTRPELQNLTTNPERAAILLFLAVCRENTELVVELLKQGALVNHTMRAGYTSLVAAILVHSPRMLQLLVEHGADPTVKNTFKPNAIYRCEPLLCTAIDRGAVECTKLLLLLDTQPSTRLSALQMAARNDDQEMARLVLDLIPPSTIHHFGSCAYYAKSPAMLDLLLSWYFADEPSINEASDNFRAAVKAGNLDLAAVYIAHGIDIGHGSSSDDNSTSLLMQEVLRHDSPCSRKLEFVLRNGVRSISLNHKGLTPEEELADRRPVSKTEEILEIDALEDCRALLAAFC